MPRSQYKKRPLPKTAEGWDSLLLKEYGYGLWPFVHSFAGLLFTFIPDYFKAKDPQSLRLGKLSMADRHDRLTWRLRELKNLERHIIKVLAEDKKDEESIPESYGTETLFKQLHVDQAVALRLRLTSRPPFYDRGRPIKFVCQVAFVWSEIMRDRMGRRWFYALGLFKWMRERITTLTFARKYLNLSAKFNEQCLAREFVIYKTAQNVKSKQKKRAEVIEKRAKMLEEYKSSYFPIGNNGSHFGIIFTNKNICFDASRKNGRIEFPDRTLFQENPNTSPVPILPGRTTRK